MTQRSNTLLLASVAVLFFVSHTRGALDDIIAKCLDGSCVETFQSSNKISFNRSAYQDSQYKMLTAGVGQMIWDDIRDGSIPASLSLSCSASLQTVVSGLD